MPLKRKTEIQIVRIVSFLPVVYLVLWMAGCATDEPKPLSPEAVEAALKPPVLELLRVEAKTIRHPLVHSVAFDERDGISPDEAAILAVWANPSLRSIRDERGIAAAQLMGAGLLPNPEFSGTVTEPTDAPPEEVTGFELGLNWEISALIRNSAAKDIARAHAASVDLDIAWEEWQVAEAAKIGVYRRFGLQSQLTLAIEVDRRLADNLSRTRIAADQGQQTALNLAAAEAAAQESHATVLELQGTLDKETLALNRILGLPPEIPIPLQPDIRFFAQLTIPPREQLMRGLEDRRLDLLALKQGYESQEATVRAAVLNQFPKIGLGLTYGKDTGDFHFWTPGITLELPVFDRNQAVIAEEKATRQKLFDEYVGRIFEARSDVASIVSEVEAVTREIAAAEAAIPVFEQFVRTSQQAFDTGNADYLSFYTAQNDLSKKRLDVLKLKQELAELGVGLEIATGLCLSGNPQTTELSAPDSGAIEPPLHETKSNEIKP